jgi:hypothetical protein
MVEADFRDELRDLRVPALIVEPRPRRMSCIACRY